MQGFHIFLCAVHVLSFFDGSAQAANGRRGFAHGCSTNSFSSQKSRQKGGPDRNDGLQFLLLGLFGLPLHGLFGPPDAVFHRAHFAGIFFPQGFGFLITAFSDELLQAESKVPFRFMRFR